MRKYEINENCEYKDIKFNVTLEYYYNDIIEEYYVDAKLGNENLRKIRNEYRKIKNLLTDEDIKNIRNQYNLSQRDFAIALGFGEVTITRYESKTVQDKAQDNVIRKSKNPKDFLILLEQNKNKYIDVNGTEKYNELYSLVLNLTKNIEYLMNEFSIEERGNKIFNFNKFKAVINYIKKFKKGLTQTFLAKVLWYIYFLNYKLKNESMTGTVYMSMPYGAYPKMYDQILCDKDIITKHSWINDHECLFIEQVNTDYSLSSEEKELIEYIINFFKNYNAKEIVDYMHNEKAYKCTKMFDVISYEYANNLSIYKEYIDNTNNSL